MSSYVNMMDDVRFTEADHVIRVEAFLRSQVTHVREHVLLRRSIGFSFYLFAQVMPAGPTRDLLASFGQPLSPAALAELTTAAQVFVEADALAAQARLDSAAKDLALDYEEAQTQLAALADRPHPPRSNYPVGSDGDLAYAQACADVDALNAADAEARAAARVAPQAVVSAATAATLALVASRPRAIAVAAAAQGAT